MNERLTEEVVAELKRLTELPLRDLRKSGGYEMLLDLLYVNAPDLIICAERELARSTRQGTHWDGCWRSHPACAEIMVLDQQKRINVLIDQNKDLTRRLEIETDARVEREKRIAELEHELARANDHLRIRGSDKEELRKRIAQLEALLAWVPHDGPWQDKDHHFCTEHCFGCAWERLKGGAE